MEMLSLVLQVYAGDMAEKNVSLSNNILREKLKENNIQLLLETLSDA